MTMYIVMKQPCASVVVVQQSWYTIARVVAIIIIKARIHICILLIHCVRIHICSILKLSKLCSSKRTSSIPHVRSSNIVDRAMSVEMGTLPIRVSLVAFGHDQDLHIRAMDLFDDSWRRLDVRDHLTRDPATGGVGHTENGTYATTQIAVFSMPEFADFATNEYRKIIEERKFKRLYGCNRGMHRSDTLTRWLQDALNALKTEDGRQVFEARAFALAEGYGTKGPRNVASNAISWLDKSWGWVAPVDVANLESIYAYRNVGKVEKSARAWMAMWSWVQEAGPRIAAMLIEEKDAGAPKPKKAPRRASTGGARDPRYTPWADVKVELDKSWPPQKGQGDVSNIEQSRGSGGDQGATNTGGAQASNDEVLDPDAETQDRGMQTEPVMWEHWNPRHWHHILKDAGCDDLAIDTFMLMAQLPHTEASYWANTIMSYLRTHHVRDASKLVHSWSIDSRKKILAKMEWQLYIDKNRW